MLVLPLRLVFSFSIRFSSIVCSIADLHNALSSSLPSDRFTGVSANPPCNKRDENHTHVHCALCGIRLYFILVLFNISI